MLEGGVSQLAPRWSEPDPCCRADEPIRFKSVLLLKASDGNVGFRAESSFSVDTLTRMAQGTLNRPNILSLQRWVMLPELSAELVHFLCAAAKDLLCFGADGSIRHKSVMTLKSLNRGGRASPKDAVDTNRKSLLP